MDQIDKFYLHFETKCPKYMRHYFDDTSGKCSRCNMVSSVVNPAWKYSDDGEAYYTTYYMLFLINNSKKKIMAILNKITDDNYKILSDKFIGIITTDIVYIEQANDVINQLLKKIINTKFMTLYAKLCKLVIDKNKKYVGSNDLIPEEETFQILLIKILQTKYNKLIANKECKHDIILLTTFICRLFAAGIISKSIILQIFNSLFTNIQHADENDKSADDVLQQRSRTKKQDQQDDVLQQRSRTKKQDYYIEIICNLLFNLSSFDLLIASSVAKIAVIGKARQNKDRIFILILNLEEEYSKKWARKRRNEKIITLTVQNRRQICIQKQNQKQNQCRGQNQRQSRGRGQNQRQNQSNPRNFSRYKKPASK